MECLGTQKSQNVANRIKSLIYIDIFIGNQFDGNVEDLSVASQWLEIASAVRNTYDYKIAVLTKHETEMKELFYVAYNACFDV